jgi:hypothetical protein
MTDSYLSEMSRAELPRQTGPGEFHGRTLLNRLVGVNVKPSKADSDMVKHDKVMVRVIQRPYCCKPSIGDHFKLLGQEGTILFTLS